MKRIFILLLGALATSVPASAQIELTGSYAPLLYEDYIERGPGSDLGDFTGMPRWFLISMPCFLSWAVA